jgi:hypothetical protein
MGNKTFAIIRALAVLGRPATVTDINPLVSVFIVEQQRVIGLFVHKRMFTGLTCVRPRLNIPIDHEKSCLTRHNAYAISLLSTS